MPQNRRANACICAWMRRASMVRTHINPFIQKIIIQHHRIVWIMTSSGPMYVIWLNGMNGDQERKREREKQQQRKTALNAGITINIIVSPIHVKRSHTIVSIIIIIIVHMSHHSEPWVHITFGCNVHEKWKYGHPITEIICVLFLGSAMIGGAVAHTRDTAKT